jgi:hypothetical protein
MKATWSVTSIATSARKRPSQGDAVGDRRDGGDVAHADLALAPHEVPGEDGDEERHDRRQVAAQHRAGDQVRDGHVESPKIPPPTSQPVANTKTIAPARMRRNAFVAAISRQARAATGDRSAGRVPRVERAPRGGRRRRLDRRQPVGGGIDDGAAPPAAERDAARMREAEARDQQREAPAPRRRATAPGSRAGPPAIR